jgi:hypothetical protein
MTVEFLLKNEIPYHFKKTVPTPELVYPWLLPRATEKNLGHK